MLAQDMQTARRWGSMGRCDRFWLPVLATSHFPRAAESSRDRRQEGGCWLSLVESPCCRLGVCNWDPARRREQILRRGERALQLPGLAFCPVEQAWQAALA